MKIVHLDLFSGIGGFAYAADQVWGDVEHVFCEIDPFCRKVLKKHWPESEIYDDIRDLTKPIKSDILTGGFPCQPFSQAGKKKGTADNRYLWPEMLRVLRLSEPTWIIAENVGGLINWNNGMVFQQICSDLETSGYEVQPFVIPSVAVNAPHKRDRVWFVAHSEHAGRDKTQATGEDSRTQPKSQTRTELSVNEPKRIDSLRTSQSGRDRWDTDWLTIATRVCRVDDGLPNRVDRLKSLGNAIVPQVAIEIMKGMKCTASNDKEK